MNEIDPQGILAMLPHRYPFLLVDRVTDTDEETYLDAVKNVTVNEPFFQGHFPDNPVFPGVLLLEAMAQASGLMLIRKAGGAAGLNTLLLSIDRAKFRRAVRPGDQLRIHTELLHLRARAAKFACKISVDGAPVAECELMCALIPKEDQP
jgi:beta-hydroxyacyl-ACP dehydratase FabZ